MDREFMGSRLKYLRDSVKLSQTKVAKLIGTVTQTAINHPTTDNQRRIH